MADLSPVSPTVGETPPPWNWKAHAIRLAYVLGIIGVCALARYVGVDCLPCLLDMLK